jgi:hypothetical protein
MNIDGVDDFNKWFFDGKVGIYPLVEESAVKAELFFLASRNIGSNSSVNDSGSLQ